MAELIHQYKKRLRRDDGVEYTVQAWGERREDGSWDGWFEFHPLDDVHSVLQTGHEVSQPKRLDLTYWASRVEPGSLETAFERATAVPERATSN